MCRPAHAQQSQQQQQHVQQPNGPGSRTAPTQKASGMALHASAHTLACSKHLLCHSTTLCPTRAVCGVTSVPSAAAVSGDDKAPGHIGYSIHSFSGRTSTSLIRLNCAGPCFHYSSTARAGPPCPGHLPAPVRPPHTQGRLRWGCSAHHKRGKPPAPLLLFIWPAVWGMHPCPQPGDDARDPRRMCALVLAHQA